MMGSPEIQGACLYLPAVHPRLEDVLAGRSVPGLRVAVICLEDALAAGDIGSAMDVLRRLPKERTAQGPRVYVRPRNAEMLAELQAWGLDRRWCGYVLPKIDVRNAATWLRPIADQPARFMPILETADVFCPTALRDLCDALTDGPLAGCIDAVRLGGTDLFSVLGTRRPRGTTVYESILGPTLSTVACYLMSRRLPTTAPVCEALCPDDTMEAEVRRDVEGGFIGKTAVNPAQVALINRSFAVTAEELDEARAILSSNEAVFRSRGAMCEVAPHTRWARRIEARSVAFGLRSEPALRSLARLAQVPAHNEATPSSSPGESAPPSHRGARVDEMIA
jgi:citrate lyase beta subunit